MPGWRGVVGSDVVDCAGRGVDDGVERRRGAGGGGEFDGVGVAAAGGRGGGVGVCDDGHLVHVDVEHGHGG